MIALKRGRDDDHVYDPGTTSSVSHALNGIVKQMKGVK